jgi:hypothetical protein
VTLTDDPRSATLGGVRAQPADRVDPAELCHRRHALDGLATTRPPPLRLARWSAGIPSCAPDGDSGGGQSGQHRRAPPVRGRANGRPAGKRLAAARDETPAGDRPGPDAPRGARSMNPSPMTTASFGPPAAWAACSRAAGRRRSSGDPEAPRSRR